MTKTGTLLAFGLGLCLLSSPAAAISVGFDPASPSVQLGEVFAVDIVFSELGGEIVSAYDLDVLYDPSVLVAADVAFGSFLGEAASFQVFNDSDFSTPGRVDLAQLSLLSDAALNGLQPDAFVAVTILFEAVAAGTSFLEFDPSGANGITGGNGQTLNPDTTSGVVSATPEPSAAILFGLGMLLVGRSIRIHPLRSSRVPRSDIE